MKVLNQGEMGCLDSAKIGRRDSKVGMPTSNCLSSRVGSSIGYNSDWLHHLHCSAGLWLERLPILGQPSTSVFKSRSRGRVNNLAVTSVFIHFQSKYFFILNIYQWQHCFNRHGGIFIVPLHNSFLGWLCPQFFLACLLCLHAKFL